MTHLVSSSYVRRMGVYLREMFPLPARAVVSLAIGLGFTGVLARIHGTRLALVSPTSLLACSSVFALMLMLRLMDELKDRDIDAVLFPDRPLPSARVSEADIRRALAAVVTLFLLAHASAGWGLASALVLLGYALLMFRHFFARERLRKSLILTLATHNPIVGLLLVHLTVLFAGETGVGITGLRRGPVVLLIVLSWSAAFAWEIARKIRASEEESAYVTYSRILGPRGAILLAAGAQTAGAAAGVALAATIPLSAAFPATLLAGYGLALATHVRFLVGPCPATSQRLRPAAEACVLATFVAGIIDHGLAAY